MPIRRWTPEDIFRILINPSYAFVCSPNVVNRSDVNMSRDEWVACNAALMIEMGAEAWLTALVQSLQDGVFVPDHRINPAAAIRIDPMFAEPHPLLTTEAGWIDGNVQSVAEVGVVPWLMGLLRVLSSPGRPRPPARSHAIPPRPRGAPVVLASVSWLGVAARMIVPHVCAGFIMPFPSPDACG